MKCHKVWRACLKMSAIQQLVVHGSARGGWQIKGETSIFFLCENKTKKHVCRGFLGGADISGFLARTLFWHKNFC